jgi:hypothetical protein
MILNPDVKIFPNVVNKKDITNEIGINFAQLFTYLQPNEYQRILTMARNA